MFKKLFFTLTMSLFMIACGEKAVKEEPTSNEKYKIGILQFVAHPALDRARDGFKEILKDKNVEFVEKNANGEISSANIIANSFVNDKVDLIYAIATPSAQAASNSSSEIPIVFAAVTDPNESGLTNKNITGVSDATDVEQQINLLLKVNPEIKKIGFIYNSSEKNSAIQLKNLEEIAKKLNLEIEAKSITQVNEVPQAVKYLALSSDAIYTPTDNLVASVMPVIASQAIEAKKIVMGSEAAHVEGGALLTKGIDYYELGKEAGKIAVDILENGKNPSDIEYKKMELTDIQINEDTLKKLEIELPAELKK